jgi:hypothetical protein
MPTKRTWRERQSVEFPSAYQAAELLTGEICYPVIQYTGYGDGIRRQPIPVWLFSIDSEPAASLTS